VLVKLFVGNFIEVTMGEFFYLDQGRLQSRLETSPTIAQLKSCGYHRKPKNEEIAFPVDSTGIPRNDNWLFQQVGVLLKYRLIIQPLESGAVNELKLVNPELLLWLKYPM